jgi:hypothetical protein
MLGASLSPELQHIGLAGELNPLVDDLLLAGSRAHELVDGENHVELGLAGSRDDVNQIPFEAVFGTLGQVSDDGHTLTGPFTERHGRFDRAHPATAITCVNPATRDKSVTCDERLAA